MEFVYERKINYYETDRMGIVHHSNYIRYMEEARCAWMEALGIPMSLLEERGFTIPTLEVNCKYLYHVTSGDVIEIVPEVSEYNGVRMTVTYEVRDRGTGREVIRGWTKHCFTTRELRPVNMKKNDREISGVMENLLEDFRKRTETEQKQED